jgi:hypothetical protein
MDKKHPKRGIIENLEDVFLDDLESEDGWFFTERRINYVYKS